MVRLAHCTSDFARLPHQITNSAKACSDRFHGRSGDVLAVWLTVHSILLNVADPS